MDHSSLITYMQTGSEQAGEALAEILEQPVKVMIEPVQTDPKIWQAWINETMGPLFSAVQMSFSGAYSGAAYLLLPRNSSQSLLDMLSELEGADTLEKDQVHEVLVEIGNVLLNICVGTLVNTLGGQVTYESPKIITIPDKIVDTIDLFNIPGDNVYLLNSSLSVSTGIAKAYIMVSMKADQ